MFECSVSQRSGSETSDSGINVVHLHRTLRNFSVQLFQIGCNCIAALRLLSLVHGTCFIDLEVIPKMSCITRNKYVSVIVFVEQSATITAVSAQ